MPSNADALRDIAHQLGNVPREATESKEDMFHFLRRKKGQLLGLADRIERAEDRRGERPGPPPTAKALPVILPAREAFYGRRKPRVVPREQLELLPC